VPRSTTSPATRPCTSTNSVDCSQQKKKKKKKKNIQHKGENIHCVSLFHLVEKTVVPNGRLDFDRLLGHGIDFDKLNKKKSKHTFRAPGSVKTYALRHLRGDKAIVGLVVGDEGDLGTGHLFPETDVVWLVARGLFQSGEEIVEPRRLFFHDRDLAELDKGILVHIFIYFFDI